MKCHKIKSLLPLLDTTEISEKQHQEIEHHLSQCDRCRHWLKEHATLVELLERDSLFESSNQNYQELEQSILHIVHRQPVYESLVKRFSTYIYDTLLFNPSLLKYSFSTFVSLIIIIAVYYALSGPTITELTPSVAMTVCDDPAVWSSAVWTDDTSDQANIAEQEDLENIQLVLLKDIIQEKTALSYEDSELDDENDIWSLVDKLDEDGIQLLISELQQTDKV